MTWRLIAAAGVLACALQALVSIASFPSSPAADTDYWRPTLHYTPTQNWINDPNGLIYDNRTRQWHLFAQYNPYSSAGSNNQSWAHAVSTDLIHWQQLPVAILVEDGIEIWSGSAVLDHNSSGLCTVPGQPCLVAVYCGHHVSTGVQDINVASSTNAALTAYRKYPGNPVIDVHSTAFRDPAAFFFSTNQRTATPHSPNAAGHWLVVITHSDVHRLEVWQSPDLLSWKLASAFVTGTEGNWDCPSLFPLMLEGTTEQWWVMGGSYSGTPGGYWVGTFDGTTFDSSTGTAWRLIDYGQDSYAWITYNDAPRGRRVMLSWLSKWDYASSTPTSPWRGAATIPRDLTLHRHHTANGSTVFLIHANPSPELYANRRKRYTLPEAVLLRPNATRSVVRDVMGFAGGSVYEVLAVVNATCAQPPCTIEFLLRVDAVTGQAMRLGLTLGGPGQAISHFMDRSNSGVQSVGDPYNAVWRPTLPAVGATTDRSLPIQVRLLLDGSCLEMFLQDGLVAASYQFFPLPARPNFGLEVNVTRGEFTLSAMDIWSYETPSGKTRAMYD